MQSERDSLIKRLENQDINAEKLQSMLTVLQNKQRSALFEVNCTVNNLI